MRFPVVFLLAALALAVCGLNAASAQWGAACLPAVAGPSAPVYEWRTIDADELALFCYGRQIGNLLLTTGEYKRRTAPGTWESEPSEPPVLPPEGVQERIGAVKKKCGCADGCKCKKKSCACKDGKRCTDGCKCGAKVIDGDPSALTPTPLIPAKGGCKARGGCLCTGEDGPCHCPLDYPCGAECDKNYGVALDRISETERATINGREVSRAAALDAIGAGGVPDDSRANSLTIMGGTAQQRRAILDALATPRFSAWRDKQIVQEYAADSPMLACGFRVSQETPTICLQRPDGKVLARVEGADAAAIERVRKCDPNYDPAKDPPRKGSPASGDDDVMIWAVVFGVVALMGLGLFGIVAIGGVVAFVRWR